MNSISDIQTGNNNNANNAYKTQYKINSGFTGTNNNKNKNNKKIKLTNNALFRSMKAINNNNEIINKGRNKNIK